MDETYTSLALLQILSAKSNLEKAHKILRQAAAPKELLLLCRETKDRVDTLYNQTVNTYQNEAKNGNA